MLSVFFTSLLMNLKNSNGENKELARASPIQGDGLILSRQGSSDKCEGHRADNGIGH